MGSREPRPRRLIAARPPFGLLAVLRLAAVFTLVLAPPLAPAAARAAEPELAVAPLVQLFDDVAFGREVGGTGDAATRRLIKWTAPVRIGVEQIGGNVSLTDDSGAPVEHVVMRAEPVPAANLAIIRHHVAALRSISGHDIALAGPGETPNLWITFTTVPFMARLEIRGTTRRLRQQLTGPGRCYFVSFAASDGVIRRAHVVANRLLSKTGLTHCLLEELTQSLGLPNDSDRLRPSIFSDHDHLLALSEGDALLLRVLYDPLMTPGMPRKAALWRAEGLFRKLLANGS